MSNGVDLPSTCPESARRPHVLLGVSGSVAAIKVPLIAELLAQFADVQIVTTDAARRLIPAEFLASTPTPVRGDEEEWRDWSHVGDPIMHIELRRWADCLVIAPLSANTLAKLAQGMCDNLLTCVVRAWDFSRPLLAAPAMNTFMWESPFTVRHLAGLESLGVEMIPPVSKMLACGDVGEGALAAPEVIAETVRRALKSKGLL